MPPGKSSLHLGESWVVEEEGYSPEGNNPESYSPGGYSPEPSPKRKMDEQLPSRHTPKRRTSAPSNKRTKSPEPEFFMPSLDAESLDGSWTANSSSRQTRNREGNFSPVQETRRASRHTSRAIASGSPEKRSRIKTAAVSPTPLRSSPRASSPEMPAPIQNFLDLSIAHTASMWSWLFDVLRGALRILKTPVSYIIAVWLLYGLGIMVRNLIATSVYASLSPICQIPGVSLLNMPFCPVQLGDKQGGPSSPVEFGQLIKVQSNFEKVLEESAGGASLPVDMKRGEASIRDLRQLVRYSLLHSKDELVLEFDGFIETARIASYDLQKFNSHVGRAVDSVISTTRWTSRVLDGIQDKRTGRGSIGAFINDNIIALFQPQELTERLLVDQYIKHTRNVEGEIFKLIGEAQALLKVLNNLEDRLDVIHGIVIREGSYVKAEKEEVLSSLWAMVGGHRGKLNKLDQQLSLSQQVGKYRKMAFAHVSGTVLRLQAMGASLEDLRERVSSPDLLRDRADIPLSVHIESIQRGVERLEKERQNIRRRENEQIRQTLDRKPSDGFLIDG